MGINLEKAIKLVKKFGWYVVPCYKVNGKHQPLVKWSTESSNDLFQIEMWDFEFKNCYFMVDIRKSNLFVVDVDNKKGKDGSTALMDLQLNNGWFPDTLITETPSGGYHYFFERDENCFHELTIEKLARGVDTPLLVPLPGQLVSGSKYNILNKKKIAKAPEWVNRKLKEISEKKEKAKTIIQADAESLDNDYAVRKSIEYLNGAQPAVEGSGGDNQTYVVVCALRDYGVSMEKAIELLLDYYNPYCSPPWGYSDLKAKVENAYRYAKNDHGSNNPEFLFDDLPSEDKKEPVKQKKDIFNFDMSDDVENSEIEPTDWIIDGVIEKGTVACVYGASNVYKSFLAIDWAYCIGTGTEWKGRAVQKQKVAYIAGEGNAGIKRRVQAWCAENKASGGKNIMLSGNGVPLLNDMFFKRAQESIQERKPDVIIIDTLAANFGGNENKVEDMEKFLYRVNELYRPATKIIIHHSGLGFSNRMRGSSALYASVESVFEIKRVRDDSTIVLSCKKQKNDDPIEDIHLKARKKFIGTCKKTGKVVDSLVLDFVAGEDLRAQDVEKILEMKAAGFKQKEIAKAIGKSNSYVSKILKEHESKGEENVRE